MLNPFQLNDLNRVLHEDRLRQFERDHLARQVLASRPKVYAPFLAGLGRGLVALGERLEGRGQAQTTPERAQS